MSKVSGSRQRLARRYATSSGPERRSPYAHARRTGVTSGGRPTLTPCQNVVTEFMTPAATVLHNKSFLRCSDDLLFDSLRCTLQARYIQYIQLVDSYIYPKLPELYVTKTRGFVFNAARTIDCIENHGCNEAITCTTL